MAAGETAAGTDMRYVALAAGFDGTLARDGHCDQRCVEALRSLAATGRKLILVTGRVLRELLEIFPEARLFDYVVAENGAVMYRPATRQSAILAQAPPEILVQELQRRQRHAYLSRQFEHHDAAVESGRDQRRAVQAGPGFSDGVERRRPEHSAAGSRQGVRRAGPRSGNSASRITTWSRSATVRTISSCSRLRSMRSRAQCRSGAQARRGPDD